MKIGVVDPSLFTGRYDDGLCAAMAGAGHDVTLFGRPMRTTDAIMPTAYEYRPYFFRLSERLRDRLGEGGAFRAAKAAEYGVQCATGAIGPFADVDVAHFQWLPFAPADRQLLRRLKGKAALVHTVHNATAYHGDASVQGSGYDRVIEAFDALIVHGAQTRAALEDRGLRPERIHVVPHPPMRLAEAGAADMAAVAAPRLPRILFFGTIRPYKGLDLLIDACLSLWRSGHGFELAIAGKPFIDIAPMLQKVRGEGFGERLVTDLGFLREERLDAHLRKADIIAFPYRHIDSSGAFLSALHYGKPILCSAVGMFAELPAGSAAGISLAAPESAEALADAVRPLVRDRALRERAGSAVASLEPAFGSWERAASRTIDVYRTVLGAGT